MEESVKKVQKILSDLGYNNKIIEFSESTHTPAEAAKVIGCELGQIAKTMVFKSKSSDSPVLVIASGSNRVERSFVEKDIGSPVKMADPQYVLEHTGFAIGGVPPIVHQDGSIVLIDEDLMRYESVWTAAGSSHAVFEISPVDLVQITKGKITKIK